MTITRTSSGPGCPAVIPSAWPARPTGSATSAACPHSVPGTVRGRDVEEEIDRAWRNVVNIAEEAGFSIGEFLYVQCVLADIGDYGAVNEWWRRAFPDVSSAPARFTFQAGALPFGAKIEIQAVAARGR